jgi:phosphate transport system substrate-binding protein
MVSTHGLGMLEGLNVGEQGSRLNQEMESSRKIAMKGIGSGQAARQVKILGPVLYLIHLRQHFHANVRPKWVQSSLGTNHDVRRSRVVVQTRQIRNKVIQAALAGAVVIAIQMTAFAQLLINGAGATFPYPIYSKWFDEYAKVDPSVRFNYQSIGSGGGQEQILAQTVDFGASDGPMSDENLAKAPGKILQIPTVAGAVVITYNLPGDPQLELDGPTIAEIFQGVINKWNDKRLIQLNPGVKFPDADIVVVHRSDGSGTSYIFTDYLSSVSKEWDHKVGRNTSVKWPTGLGAKGSEGVAGQIKQLPGTVGYVELAYAHQNKLPVSSIKNAAGAFTSPSMESVTAALASAKIPEDFRFSIVNPPGEGAYPIAGATWLLIYQQQTDPTKGKKLVDFLVWAITKGESMAQALDYAPLPEALDKRILDLIKTIKY